MWRSATEGFLLGGLASAVLVAAYQPEWMFFVDAKGRKRQKQLGYGGTTTTPFPLWVACSSGGLLCALLFVWMYNRDDLYELLFSRFERRPSAFAPAFGRSFLDEVRHGARARAPSVDADAGSSYAGSEQSADVFSDSTDVSSVMTTFSSEVGA